jgi:hypothetical protein
MFYADVQTSETNLDISPHGRSKVIAFLDRHLGTGIDLLLTPKEKPTQQRYLCDLETVSTPELMEKHSLDHTVTDLRAMYGQDFGLERLAQEIRSNQMR